MTYETLCADNRVLYQQLEDNTHDLKSCDPIYHESEHNALTRFREVLKSAIDFNLDKLDIFFTVATDYTPPVLKLRKYRRPERGDGKAIVDYYCRNYNLPISVIAKELDIPVDTVSRYITEHLSYKFDLMPR